MVTLLIFAAILVPALAFAAFMAWHTPKTVSHVRAKVSEREALEQALYGEHSIGQETAIPVRGSGRFLPNYIEPELDEKYRGFYVWRHRQQLEGE